jgi:hypothetical protein
MSKFRAELEQQGTGRLLARSAGGLAPANDPLGVDTDPNHRDGAWLADMAAELGAGDRSIRLRGLHEIEEAGRPRACSSIARKGSGEMSEWVIP